MALPGPGTSASGSIPMTDVPVVIRIGRRRSRSAVRAASGRDMPSASLSRACAISRIALLTTIPSRMTKPIMPSRSSGVGLNRLRIWMPITPPTVASGSAMITRAESRAERNTDAMMTNSSAAARMKLLLSEEIACNRASASPP